jgi:poly-gamma-glutamate capsule biosynthesis protein CapA/YwtB (metallophosphatase superfamily)
MKKLVNYLLFSLISLVTFAQDTINEVSFLFIGDIMQHDRQIIAAYDSTKKAYDYDHYFEYVTPIIKSADIAIANLEVTLAGRPYKGYPQFSAPEQLAVAAKKSGIDYLMTANNHSNDRSKQGVERTIDVLDSLEMPHFGTYKTQEARDTTYPLLIEKNGIRVALLNYTYGTNGLKTKAPNVVNMIDQELMLADIKKAQAMNVDKIIACMHWGKEYLTHPDDYQKHWAKFVMQHGVDIVVGGHPHYIQPIEYYPAGTYDTVKKERLIIYSLGNFVSGQRAERKDGGSMLQFSLRKDSTGNVSVISQGYYLNWVWVPVVKGQKRYTVCPVSSFDQTALKNKFTEAELEKFNRFKKNSEVLYNTDNKNVPQFIYNPITALWELKQQ